MIWIEIIILIFKYGPLIIELVIAIWNLIKKQPTELQPMYKAQLLQACKLMNQKGMKQTGTNALVELKARLEANA